MSEKPLNYPMPHVIALKKTHANEYLTGSELSFSCYENVIPLFVAMEMEQLYENFYSSFIKFNIQKETVNASVYVVSKEGKITTIFLFRTENKVVRVLNEFISIADDELRAFSHFIFSRYKDITAIAFHAIQTEIRQLPFPYQQYNCIEDIVLTLPISVQEYDGMLSKKLRSNIRYSLNKIKRNHPSFSFEIFENESADEQYIRDIIQFNQARMSSKNKSASLSEAETRQIIDLVRACGKIAVVKVDGNICAGGILFQFGANYFGFMNAHSPAFNEYGLGILCAYLTICECILRGGKELNFSWGREEYKYRLQGEQRDFDELIIYRSHLHMAGNSRLAMKMVVKSITRQARLWLLDPKRKNHFALRSAKTIIRHLRGKIHS